MSILAQRCKSMDETNIGNLDSSFNLLDKNIIGKNVTKIKPEKKDNSGYPCLLESITRDIKSTPLFHKGYTINYQRQKNMTPNRECHRAMSIQVRNNINGNITIINNFIKQTTDRIMPNIGTPGSKIKKRKSILKYLNGSKTQKSVKIKQKQLSFSLIDETKGLPPKLSNISNNTEGDPIKEEIDFDKIFKSNQDNKQQRILDIDKIAICNCNKQFGSIKGFSALTYHNQNKIHNDKLTILINKNIAYGKGIMVNDMPNKQINFFGLYHGINGDFTSSYLKKHMHHYIFNNKKLISNTEYAIIKAHKTIEKECVNDHNKVFTENDGSCSLILCEISKKIYVSNLGSSRCVLSLNYGSEIFNLSNDHTPLNENEAKRIKSASFQIQIESNKRIARIYPSGIKVSRILGFSNAKANNLNKKQNANGIISIPEIMTIESNEDMDFIIMASEGIINYLSNTEIIKLAYTAIKQSLYFNESYESMLNRIITTIAKEAIDKESKESLSIILLSLDNLDNIYKEKMIQKVNQTIAKLNQTTEDNSALYSLKSYSLKCKPESKVSTSQLSKHKKSNNNSSLSFNPLMSLKIKSQDPIINQDTALKSNQLEDDVSNKLKDITRPSPSVNKLRFSASLDPIVNKKKKKKRAFCCLCWC